jgi:hypothetical protein
VDSVINRYYDPTTDQFLSIDPEVAETDQPYVYTGDDPLNEEDPLGLGPTATQTLTAAIAALGARLKAEEQHPSAANLAAVIALKQRVASDSQTVNSQDEAAIRQTNTGTTQVPSAVAKADSNYAQAQSCERGASGFIVKGGIAGSMLAAGGGGWDILKAFGIELGPETAGLSTLALGIFIIVATAGYGIFQASQC